MELGRKVPGVRLCEVGADWLTGTYRFWFRGANVNIPVAIMSDIEDSRSRFHDKLRINNAVRLRVDNAVMDLVPVLVSQLMQKLEKA